MKSRWVDHRGERILYGDFRDFGRNVDGLRAEIDACDDVIRREPANSVLSLVDLRGTTASVEALEVLKESAARKGDQILREAVLGVTGIQKVLAQAVATYAARELALFDSLDAAQDWLVVGGPGGVSIKPRP